MNKVIFLDRDGVINLDILNYTWRIEDFKFLDGIFEACRLFREKGFQLIVITNQGGIAKGLYGHEDVSRLHAHMIEEFKKNSVDIVEVYYCPHHDDYGKCLCRKPGSLLVEKAVARFDVDPRQSYFIGDKERDVLAGEGAGVKGILVDVNDDLRKVVSRIS
jgi:D-glycero-D-manno-heptose 1,7-bisphosphate phosphatase